MKEKDFIETLAMLIAEALKTQALINKLLEKTDCQSKQNPKQKNNFLCEGEQILNNINFNKEYPYKKYFPNGETLHSKEPITKEIIEKFLNL